jgi:hypothetical protein
MNGGTIAGHGKLQFPRFKAQKLKRRAWGEREGDSELTQAKKKGSNQPASSDDEQPNLPRVPSSQGSISRG